MEDFFSKQTPSSRIKANIVAEYFPQYCKILLKRNQKEIRYLDLFAGPGIYEDQSHSTPLLIANSCANDLVLSNKVRLMFNDNSFCSQLKSNFEKHFPEGTFNYKPVFGNRTVGECDRIASYLSRDVITPNPHPFSNGYKLYH
jgi:three-Cys-motif partner protein